MKTIKGLLMLLILSLTMMMTSCEETGDNLYSIDPIGDIGSYNSYKVVAEKSILEAVKQVATPYGESSYLINGEKKSCNAKISDAVNRAMDKIESDPNYNKVFVISGITLEVKNIAADNEVVLSRKFKD